MEKPSPTDSISPSTTSGSSNPSAQPTYTTAGTIYNPNTSQPLQPPTRRGRAPKWTSGGAYSDLSLLPRSVLASLQAKSNGRSSPYNVAHYTPLQQNYDRAANPVNKNGCFDEMRIRWDSTPSGAALEVDEVVGYNAVDRDHEEDDEDEDGDDGMDSIMMNMPVKSLHNLASYPNPSQKKAQKALLRPIKPRPNPQNTLSAHDLAVRPWDPRPSPDPVYDRSWAKLRPSYSDSVASQLMAKAELQSITERSQRQGPSPPPTSEDFDPKNAWLTHMALGAPRPLTAGPPGQRQYRASTFKSTFKALSTETKATKQVDDDDAYAVTARVLQHAGIDDARGKLEGSLSRHEAESTNYTQLFQGSQILQTGSPSGSYGIVGSPDRGDKRRGMEEFVASDAPLARSEWGMKVSCQQPRENPEHETTLAARAEKMNIWWHSGCDRLCGEAVGEAGKARDPYVGVIGDGRPGQSGWNRHKELGIEEANRMEAAEHSKQLLEMAMGNLERRLPELLTKSREQDTN